MSRSEEPRSFQVRVRQVHHAWHTVTAASAEGAVDAARRQTSPEWTEYAHDLPVETWDVYDEQGEILIEGDPVVRM